MEFHSARASWGVADHLHSDAAGVVLKPDRLVRPANREDTQDGPSFRAGASVVWLGWVGLGGGGGTVHQLPETRGMS